MSDGVLTFQIDPDPCVTLACAMQTDPVETCGDHRCPHRWAREAREDRAKREGEGSVQRNVAGRERIADHISY